MCMGKKRESYWKCLQDEEDSILIVVILLLDNTQDTNTHPDLEDLVKVLHKETKLERDHLNVDIDDLIPQLLNAHNVLAFCCLMIEEL